MFAGFNLKLEEEYSEYYLVGLEKFSLKKKQIKERLDKYINEHGSLDGSMMQEDWFPQIRANVFISHSHNDLNKAIGLAGWLYSKFQLEVFIDSCIWEYCNDLLKVIDNEFCWNNDGLTYNYSKRNYSTSHVHTMLSVALAKMIDRTECLFFLNTPNSISASDLESNQTNSPWIYLELALANMIRQKRLQEYRLEKFAEAARRIEENQLTIMYDVSLKHLHDLSHQDLLKWGNKSKKAQYPLDDLYELKSLLPEGYLSPTEIY